MPVSQFIRVFCPTSNKHKSMLSTSSPPLLPVVFSRDGTTTRLCYRPATREENSPLTVVRATADERTSRLSRVNKYGDACVPQTTEIYVDPLNSHIRAPRAVASQVQLW
jgi:hypothetical protein